ncbi:MAG: formate dehydrogenase subunit delta [Devosia sp.]|nr:formate dehydrogenase subunit delta [Devosia sp.]
MSEDLDLVRMANNIAANFAVYPEAEAIAGIVRHISDFWPRPMRERLVVLVRDGAGDLAPLALAAGRRLVAEFGRPAS